MKISAYLSEMDKCSSAYGVTAFTFVGGERVKMRMDVTYHDVHLLVLSDPEASRTILIDMEKIMSLELVLL